MCPKREILSLESIQNCLILGGRKLVGHYSSPKDPKCSLPATKRRGALVGDGSPGTIKQEEQKRPQSITIPSTIPPPLVVIIMEAGTYFVQSQCNVNVSRPAGVFLPFTLA